MDPWFFFFLTWISEILTIDWKDLEAVAVIQQLASPVPKLLSRISFYLPVKGTEVFFGEMTDSRNRAGTRHQGNGTPLQYSCLENPMDGGAW